MLWHYIQFMLWKITVKKIRETTILKKKNPLTHEKKKEKKGKKEKGKDFFVNWVSRIFFINFFNGYFSKHKLYIMIFS